MNLCLFLMHADILWTKAMKCDAEIVNNGWDGSWVGQVVIEVECESRVEVCYQ